MKILMISASAAIVALIGLTSIVPKKEVYSSKAMALNLDKMPATDSISIWEVREMVKNEVVNRLENKAGIEPSWSYMDKSGHRTKVFNNVDYNFKNAGKYYVKINEENEVYGDVVRIDGALKSHICSFKVVYPGKQIFLRKSVLDEWQTVVDFTGVEEGTPMRLGFEQLIEIDEQKAPIEIKSRDDK